MDEYELRESGEIGLEVRGLGKTLRGYAIRFNAMADIGGMFREQIAPEAIDRTLREGVDLRALIDHEPRLILGRLQANPPTLRVEKDSKGLRVEIDPDESISYASDIVRSVARRDVTGMSFAFRTVTDHWDDTTDPPTRTVTDMLVREVSIVTFPAYPQTDIGLRSLRASRAVRTDRPMTVSERMLWSKNLDIPPGVGRVPKR
jgi:HK97 family phage prohead protease